MGGVSAVGLRVEIQIGSVLKGADCLISHCECGVVCLRHVIDVHFGLGYRYICVVCCCCVLRLFK